MSNINIRYKGEIRKYIMWPVWMTLLVGIFAVGMFFIDVRAGIGATIFFAVYAGVACFLYLHDRNTVFRELVSFATQYGQIQKQLLMDLEIPYALLDEAGKIIWANDAFEKTMDITRKKYGSITNVIPEITNEKLPNVEHETEIVIAVNGHDFRASMNKVTMKDLMDRPEEDMQTGDEAGSVDYDSYLIALYMFDISEVSSLSRQIEEQKTVCGLIYMDNYDEALESVDEARRSLAVALIDRQINKYFSKVDAIVKKLEKDKFLVVMKRKELDAMAEGRFAILDEVKNANIGNELAFSLSIGFGAGSDSLLQNYEYARTAIDLALGRGGDQAIIKTDEEISYFGGKREVTGKNTRVKARVKAHALREIIENSDHIVIMGHKILDVDAFGSSIGIYRVARTFNKKVNIVVDEVTTSIRSMLEMISKDGKHDPSLFVSREEAVEIASASDCTLVVVDVNKPSFTGCPPLLDLCHTIVVLDHHRQGSEKIENATLSYIEPYASSASEMVSEVLQYISDRVDLTANEADCLYGGMMIDTNNFMTKTGVRTFEAAAYLRKNGADVTRVRKMFRDDVASYKAKAEIVSNAEIYDGAFAMAQTPDTIVDSPTIIGAEAANELLNINGIRASFVFTMHQGEVFISARSIDDVNVQVIMEQLGGGGHMNSAGTQLENTTIEEAKKALIDVIVQLKEKGEIR
ncbi:MAG: DHH family phosphoesterase [Lachnospiraceae bacterium]|nr:DHH family phosphoesterase [Lachnospiraceae bacterium]